MPQNNLDQLCFRYEYDQRSRLIREWIPGSFDHQYVYDARNRKVMSRDMNQVSANQWIVTKYDELNRVIETGIWTNGSSFATHLAAAAISTNYPSTSTNYELLTENHYDSYSGVPGTLTTLLDNTYAAQFITTEKYLDNFMQFKYKKDNIDLLEFDYQAALELESYIRNHPLKVHDPCEGNGLYKHMERVNEIFTMAKKMKWIDDNPFDLYESGKTRVQKQRLTVQYFVAIENSAFENPKLNYVRDLLYLTVM